MQKLKKKALVLDSLKWIAGICALVTAGVVGNYYFSAESLLYQSFGFVGIGCCRGLGGLADSKR